MKLPVQKERPHNFEVGFDIYICSECNTKLLHCPICQRLLSQIAPHGCTKHNDRHIASQMYRDNLAWPENCIVRDGFCCSEHPCQHIYLKASIACQRLF